MPVVRAADDPKFDLSGVNVSGLATPTRGAAETIMYRVDLRPTQALPQHRHDHEEVFHVLAGSLTSVLDGAEHPADAGDTVMIPKGTLHHAYAGDAGATFVVAMPVGTLFMREDGEPAIPPWGR